MKTCLFLVIITLVSYRINVVLDIYAGADPGFPVGGPWTRLGRRGPLTWVLFGENVCENERIGSRRGHGPENFVCRSANDMN